MTKSVLRVRDMTWMAMFVALLAISGMFSIPVGPVPITLQTLVVMLAGSVLGARRGFISMVVFILLAAVGAPVLSGGGGGIAHLLGPTGGYIISWPFAAFLIGWIIERWGDSVWKLMVAHVVGGVAFIHLVGFTWVVSYLHLPLNMKTFITSLFIFLPGDLVKAVVASPVASAVYRALPALRPGRGQSVL
ncbi:MULTISPECIES: biotin transporter BioY [Thermoactinomyces]|jgi:biotin transport system substrate-specific component|uniref:Biotin transporter n=1 Tax=Thermoactinomyces daqus TaxID=1329516 RepID=A0A7W1XBR9_9BACL|nr:MULTISPECIES: biotin transporter BioY [Thermoactinomyces]MBA4543638.1 biotin transporter BioY [Thermoactinomyces daqus]MBH8597089.1 biotin transporter BioY [Thermoactinomyces sp. CICC 10523]MBH8602649.1 biotin transporter BioY [Thermoactinomyces sp. CICC 10522]MBH8606240.1 biotin transporter BioY [Thermoactinomyces sp. CICC 10521]